LESLAPLAQPRLNQLTDFVPMTSFIYADRLTYDSELLLKGVESPERAPVLLRIAQWEIEKMVTWDADGIKAMFARIGEKEDLKFKKLLSVFFVAISGRAVSLPLFDAMVVIGRDMCLRRVQYAIELLEQSDIKLSGKALKKLTKDYAYRYRS
jgi:glutamyl-tRNA synthetase